VLKRLLRHRRPSRADLVERKRRLEGEINALRSELRRVHASGSDAAALEQRLAAIRQRHYETRLEIDRADPDS
jgi:hypothetical protein